MIRSWSIFKYVCPVSTPFLNGNMSVNRIITVYKQTEKGKQKTRRADRKPNKHRHLQYEVTDTEGLNQTTWSYRIWDLELRAFHMLTCRSPTSCCSSHFAATPASIAGESSWPRVSKSPPRSGSLLTSMPSLKTWAEMRARSESPNKKTAMWSWTHTGNAYAGWLGHVQWQRPGGARVLGWQLRVSVVTVFVRASSVEIFCDLASLANLQSII